MSSRCSLSQFKDLLVAILIVAAVISMFSDNVESTLVIFAVLIMNAIWEPCSISRRKSPWKV